MKNISSKDNVVINSHWASFRSDENYLNIFKEIGDNIQYISSQTKYIKTLFESGRYTDVDKKMEHLFTLTSNSNYRKTNRLIMEMRGALFKGDLSVFREKYRLLLKSFELEKKILLDLF